MFQKKKKSKVNEILSVVEKAHTICVHSVTTHPARLSFKYLFLNPEISHWDDRIPWGI